LDALAGEVSKGGVLKQGERGPAVLAVKDLLGMNAASRSGPNGDLYGPGTRDAVMAFQRSHGLQPDGVVGPGTFKALRNAREDALLKSAIESGRTFQRDDNAAPSPEVRALQRMLGMAEGGQTGVFGASTEQRLKEFQKSAGMKDHPSHPLGICGKTTYQQLSGAGDPAALGKLAGATLQDGASGTCVATTLKSLYEQGFSGLPGATGNDLNNPRGAMVQMMRFNHPKRWVNPNYPGSEQKTINSAYGTVSANVLSASAYNKLVAEGKIPEGAIVFTTIHGWQTDVLESAGNDMGVMQRRNGQLLVHNYADMPDHTAYGDGLKEVVILLPAQGNLGPNRDPATDTYQTID
jgi:peptidoglycan hydrolase-like protein with peptidoglycan-binding domain